MRLTPLSPTWLWKSSCANLAQNTVQISRSALAAVAAQRQTQTRKTTQASALRLMNNPG